MKKLKRARALIHCRREQDIEVLLPAAPGSFEREDVRIAILDQTVGENVSLCSIRLHLTNGFFTGNRYLAMEDPVRIFLEAAEQPKNITALYMFCDWWTRPAFVTSFSDIPPRTQVLLLQYEDCVACLVPAVGRDFKTTAEKGTDTELCLTMSAGIGGQKDVEEPLFVLAEGATAEEAVHRVFAWLAADRGIKTREQRRLPEMFSYLGWCSWDAFYRDITEEKVRRKADELAAKKVPVRWMLMDDGWFLTEDEKICELHPDKEKFPDGFATMIRDIKAEGTVRWFGVWHALGGFWGGVSERSGLAEREREFLYHTQSGKIIPSPISGEGFYRDWYEALKREEIDFVKVDGQSALAGYIENDFSIGSAASGIHRQLEGAAMYMDGSIINCMGMAMENILSRPNSAVNRNSDDFFPNREGSFAEHLLQNAYNAVYQDELYYCDWDMFWTEHEAAKKHSLLRAISGGPVYFSDRIGATDREILRPLTYLDGRILRMDRSAKPTEDCMFTDPMTSGVLKLQNTAPWGADRRGGGIAVYNLTGQEQSYSFVSTDIRGLEPADRYWVYDYFGERVFTLERGETFKGVLEKDGFGWFVFLPKGAHGACAGLLDKYVGFAAVESIAESTDTATVTEGIAESADAVSTFIISESGTIGFFTGQKPGRVLADGVNVTAQLSGQGFLYKLALPEKPVKVAISICW